MSKTKRKAKKIKIRESRIRETNDGSEPNPFKFNIDDLPATLSTSALWNQLLIRQELAISDVYDSYPYNADEIMNFVCDNGVLTEVPIRIFMSIRARYIGKADSLMLEHKDAMMKKETEWLTKMENEKIELGKQIAIRDQMVLEARAETNEYKSMNQSILSQISDKEAKIAQVSLPNLATITRNQLF